MKAFKFLFIFGILLIWGYKDCRSQDIIKIASSIEGIHREEIIENLIINNKNEYSLYFPINIKTENYQGKVVVRYTYFYDYYMTKNRSQTNLDSSFFDLMRKLLINRDTLVISDNDLNSPICTFQKVNQTNLFNLDTKDKNEILLQFFDNKGIMHINETDSFTQFIILLDQWNLFVDDYYGYGNDGFSIYDYTFTLGYEFFFDKMLYESYQKFLNHLDTTQDFIILTSSFLLELSNTRGFQEITKRDIISFDKKYIELADIGIERDLLFFVFSLSSYKKTNSGSNTYTSIDYIIGKYTYKYDPIFRKYFFVSEEFKIEEPLE